MDNINGSGLRLWWAAGIGDEGAWASLSVAGTVGTVAKLPVTLVTGKKTFTSVCPQMAVIHVFVSKCLATEDTLMAIISCVKVHVHSDVVPAHVHFVTHKAYILGGVVTEPVHHKFCILSL